ncbi:MAG: acetylglutamate kinase [Deltaproteobacteria bacterium]|nr:acetylglutamate kinase [Deltaproteobacteria bacterium]
MLPYFRKFYGKVVVIKYGGHAMVDNNLKDMFARDVLLMKYIGIYPVIVHGGGPQIGEVLKKLGKESKFIQGMRVTDKEMMDIVEMVLVGNVNKEIVGLINKNGGNAVGISGKDGNLILAEKYYLSEEKAKNTPPEIIDIGLVGKVKATNVGLVKALLDDGFIPVIAPTGASEDGDTYNINADLIAGAVAGALKSEKLILLTDVTGVLDENKSLIKTLNSARAEEMIATGVIAGGMFPKIKCALKAVAEGVGKVHIIDGRQKHAVLLEMFTDVGIGTEVVL